MSDMHITPPMSSDIISKLGPHKARGFVSISEIIIRKCAPEAAPVLTKLSNKYLAASPFPAC